VSTSAASPRQPARRRDEDVPSITSAPEPLADDQARRTRRYLMQMGFRVVCFIGAYFASGWLRWTMVAIAVVIPYVAVILVNAGRDKVRYDTSAMVPDTPKELPPLPDGAVVVEQVIDHVDDPDDGPADRPDDRPEER
jgi:hypothetical protein